MAAARFTLRIASARVYCEPASHMCAGPRATTPCHRATPRGEAEREDDYDTPPGLAPSSHAGVTRIQGTLEQAFPLNKGWKLEGSKHTTAVRLHRRRPSGRGRCGAHSRGGGMGGVKSKSEISSLEIS